MLISSFLLMALGFYILLKATESRTPKGFLVGMGVAFLYIILSIPIAMGYMWPVFVIVVLWIIYSLVLMIFTYLIGKTKQSFLWLVMMLAYGACLVVLTLVS